MERFLNARAFFYVLLLLLLILVLLLNFVDAESAENYTVSGTAPCKEGFVGRAGILYMAFSGSDDAVHYYCIEKPFMVRNRYADANIALTLYVIGENRLMPEVTYFRVSDSDDEFSVELYDAKTESLFMSASGPRGLMIEVLQDLAAPVLEAIPNTKERKDKISYFLRSLMNY